MDDFKALGQANQMTHAAEYLSIWYQVGRSSAPEMTEFYQKVRINEEG
jgi:hypothetical protein